MRSVSNWVIIVVVISAAIPLQSQLPYKTGREIAFTFDDLPAGAAEVMTAAEIRQMTAKLVGALRQEKVPAVGFVNEKKLYKSGEVDQRIQSLNIWLDAGYELGNHTFSHTSLNRAGLAAWEDDVIQGEGLLRMLLAQHKMNLRYFRHPYLDTGRDLKIRQEAEAFLVGRGYRIAPVTIDAWDWMFADVYEDAKRHNDSKGQEETASAYLAYSDKMFDYCEQLSKKIVGYEPKQILLLHGTELEGDHVAELIRLIRKRGYRFISLEDALSDPAYGLPDSYVGEEGTSWLEHWAVAKGEPVVDFPVVPTAILERDNALRKGQ